jgi:alkanesulfonate monooxygenase SsuD/methylene tetrahydromethanopterin reductase-like flavin-dependent oxidoreductase (luciferase family)
VTVYVDDMEADFKPDHAPGRKYVMCHMIADTDAELHAMADKIGVARKWFQGDHYDIAKSKRTLAVRAGAREITQRQLGCMALLRRRGLPMGTPETAIERLRAAKEART